MNSSIANFNCKEQTSKSFKRRIIVHMKNTKNYKELEIWKFHSTDIIRTIGNKHLDGLVLILVYIIYIIGINNKTISQGK